MYSVVFDMGGVVLDWDPPAILAAFYPRAAVRAQLQTALFEHPDWRAFDGGELDEAALCARLAARTGRPVAEMQSLMRAIRDSLLPKPGTLALIERLHARGVPLYVLSNMAAATYAHLRSRHDWWRLFRGVLISGLVRKLKPDAEIFDQLLAEFGLQAPRTIFIDDLRPNIEAAAALGMPTIWFRDAAQCGRELAALLDAGCPS